MELIDPRSGQVVWADSWGAPMPPPRADGLAYIERGARTDRTVPPEDINALAMIGRETGITPRLNALNQMLNPVNSLYEAGQHSKNMLAPGRTGWERVGDLGGMLSGMAGTVAPMFAASKGAIPAADAVMEGIAGYSAMPRAMAGDFMADEFGGLRLYRGETGSAEKIKGGIGESYLFGTPHEDVARLYGDNISQIELADDARILTEGSREFAKVTGRKAGPLIRSLKRGENLKDAANAALERAKEAGFDAVEFNSLRDMGTAILNRAIIKSMIKGGSQ